MSTTATEHAGLDWLTMRPEHFDRGKLPRKHRNAPEGLFSVIDVLPPNPAPEASAAPELSGQGELFEGLT
jgi:hypothetical protein